MNVPGSTTGVSGANRRRKPGLALRMLCSSSLLNVLRAGGLPARREPDGRGEPDLLRRGRLQPAAPEAPHQALPRRPGPRPHAPLLHRQLARRVHGPRRRRVSDGSALPGALPRRSADGAAAAADRRPPRQPRHGLGRRGLRVGPPGQRRRDRRRRADLRQGPRPAQLPAPRRRRAQAHRRRAPLPEAGPPRAGELRWPTPRLHMTEASVPLVVFFLENRLHETAAAPRLASRDVAKRKITKRRR